MFSAFSRGAPPQKTEAEIKELVSSKLITQAGVDFESRPLLVFYGCYLPDPAITNYDFLLACVLDRLDQFVESDYVMVFFASGGNYAPSWAWLFKTYANLSRKYGSVIPNLKAPTLKKQGSKILIVPRYRKNLKNLFIVHPTMWPKLLMQFMGAVVSPKFARKVVWVYSLSNLAKLIPLERLDIPPVIHDVNIKYERPSHASQVSPQTSSRSLQSVAETRQFGADLALLMGADGEKGLPPIVADCIAFIRSHGLDSEGIFRRSPASTAMQNAKKAYDRGEQVDLEAVGGLHLACSLLKLFFRDLPEPLFPMRIYDTINGISSCNGTDEQADYISSKIFPLLSPPSKVLFIALFDLLHDVHEHSSTNLMNATNLAIVWAPNVVRSDNPALDFAMCAGGGGVGALVKTGIEKWPLPGIAAAYVKDLVDAVTK
ncbi:hypothetical protein HK097_010598 [Rhizophlyctis rosea]|uniref:Rho-GAP domain-containing protein n=1 Tax=Rhizophlyctis rosea TaxID=64517 RepID=A0AAD5SKA5_9FUNG|nr:hypothetical protein HK097_010598 [Rhizophlyctis rosea]